MILLSGIGVLGDYFLKLASKESSMFANRWFVIGASLFALTAFGWVWAMRTMKLAEIGAVYGVATVLLLALIGLTFFKERLSTQEIIGIVLAIASITLLSRFS